MRETLEECVRFDELANKVYLDLERRCSDPEVAALMAKMAVDEASHVSWWRELLEAWDRGLLPDAWPATSETASALASTVAELGALVPSDGSPVDAEYALTTAAHLEFYALDPIFGQLLDLTEPEVGRRRHIAYDGHIDRLIDAFGQAFAPGSAQAFLAQMLHRAQRDNRVLAQYATHDPLTGLGNRRALAAQAKQLAAWAARYGHPLSFLLLDIDNFKAVNDEYGHASGDLALEALADALASTVRSSDLASRYGGDGFAVLAPELDPAGARELAQRLAEAARGLRVAAAGGAEIRLTVSIGVATALDPPDSDPRDVDELLAAADRSLYAAKNSGRDRVADPVVLTRAG